MLYRLNRQRNSELYGRLVPEIRIFNVGVERDP